jgi:hypothetical protein
VRSELLRPGDLPEAAREALYDRLYAVWSEYFEGLDRAAFAAFHFPDHARIQVWYGEGGEVAGFANPSVLRLRVGGRPWAAFASGLFFRLSYRGRAAAFRAGLALALRFKLRHPFTALGYLSVVTNAASFTALARTYGRYYPHPTRPTPADVEAAVQSVARLRGLRPVGADPWVVSFPPRLKTVEALKGARSLQAGNRHADFFARRVPGWERGESLLVWIPLDLADMAGALWRALLGRGRAT